MWIFLNNAFLSIVEGADPDMLLVRGRLKGDIERAFPGSLALEGEGTDYRFRARVPRQIVADRLARAVAEIDYRNFKSSVKEKLRHSSYMHVWSVMEEWQCRAAAQEKTAQEKTAQEKNAWKRGLK